MYFLIEDYKFLEKYNTIWDKVKIINKIKIKLHGDEVTDFQDKEVPELDSNHACLAVISLVSALKKYENYYSQVFL